MGSSASSSLREAVEAGNVEEVEKATGYDTEGPQVQYFKYVRGINDRDVRGCLCLS